MINNITFISFIRHFHLILLGFLFSILLEFIGFGFSLFYRSNEKAKVEQRLFLNNYKDTLFESKD